MKEKLILYTSSPVRSCRLGRGSDRTPRHCSSTGKGMTMRPSASWGKSLMKLLSLRERKRERRRDRDREREWGLCIYFLNTHILVWFGIFYAYGSATKQNVAHVLYVYSRLCLTVRGAAANSMETVQQQFHNKYLQSRHVLVPSPAACLLNHSDTGIWIFHCFSLASFSVIMFNVLILSHVLHRRLNKGVWLIGCL